MATPFMSLTLPTVSITIGPTWATQLNAALTLIDSHQHTPGTGQLVPTAGLNINADLAFSNFNVTTLRTTRFFNQSAPLALPTDINCLFVSGGELWFNNQAGVPLQLTANGSLSVGSIGGITGLGGTSAALTYTSGTGTFIFTQNPSQAANIDAGNVILRNPIGTGNPGVTLSVGALSGSYVLTLASALPGSASFLTSTASGQLGYIATLGALTTANLSASAGILGSQLSASAGITGTQLSASAGIVGGQLANSTVTGSKIASATVTRANEAAVGQQVSASCGNFQANTTPSNVTNLSVTLTTTGRPVMVLIQPDTGGASDLLIGSGITLTVTLLRDGVTIGSGAYNSNFNTLVTSLSIVVLDTPAVGTRTWAVQAVTNTGTAQVQNYLLAAYEL